MRRIVFAALILAGLTPAAFACSEDELQAKSIELAGLVQAIVAKDPAQEGPWKQKQIDVDRVAEATSDLDTICAAYDKAIAEAQTAH